MSCQVFLSETGTGMQIPAVSFLYFTTSHPSLTLHRYEIGTRVPIQHPSWSIVEQHCTMSAECLGDFWLKKHGIGTNTFFHSSAFFFSF